MIKINEKVEDYKAKHVLALYKIHPDEILRDYVNETETRDDYEGREVLELIQNAVDQVEIGGKIYIGLSNNLLTVSNTGVPFDFEGVKSLMKSHLSPKRVKKNTIGQKGLGFRSILNWSNNISIFSHDLSIRFSESYRKSYFEKEDIFQPTALLVAPELINSEDNNGYDTIIKIRILDDKKVKEVKRQLFLIDKYTLLFLDKINEMIVDIEGRTTEYKRESDCNVVIINDSGVNNIFNTYKKSGVINDKNYEIIVAYDESIVKKDNKLYSYFETSINFPIKWKCHATFDLDTNRSGIKKSEDNLLLLAELASFICEKAQEITILSGKPFEVFDSLIKSSDFPVGLIIKGIDFNDTYQKCFEQAKVLPTLSKNLVSLSDKPIFYTDIPFFFYDIKNINILIESADKRRNEILNRYSTQFQDNELLDIINDCSEAWDVTQRITIFLWWEKEFARSPFLPKLLKAIDGTYIKEDTIVYFVRGRDLNIPTWSRIYQLDTLDEQELKMQLQKIDIFREEINNESNPIIERIISRNSGRDSSYYSKKLLPHVMFRDADASTILTPINSSVDNNFEYAKLLVKWLWDNYSDKEDWVPPADLVFNFPTKNNLVDKSINLYFDDTYDNPLGSKLFVNNTYQPFISSETIGIMNNELLHFRNFVHRLGVTKFPRIERQNIQDSNFRSQYSPTFLMNKLPSYELHPRNPSLIELSFFEIKDLEEVLTNLEVYEVFKWIRSDDVLFDNLKLKHEGIIKFSYTVQTKSFRTHTFIDYSQSYIRYVFKNTKWLELDGVKYAPRQCVFAYSGLNIGTVVPTISNDFIKNVAALAGIPPRDLRALLADVGVSSSIIGLESEDFYDFLLKLPTLDESGQISEKIYREVIDYDKFELSDSSNRRKFINEGQVFTQNRNGKSYQPASKSYFSNSIQVNVGNYPIMCTPLRNGSFEVFNRIFGVNKFQENYEISRESVVIHPYDSEFQKNFKDFILYARAWSERNDRIKSQIDSIQISIVSQVALIENNETRSIDKDYMLITDKKSWLIFLDKDKTIDNRLISKCIEEVFAQVANTSSDIPNQLGELFRDCEGRKFLVEKHFGTIAVINQTYQNQIRASLANAIGESYESRIIDGIDYEQFRSVENCPLLLELLRKKNMDLMDLKTYGFEYIDYIDFRPFYQIKVRDYVSINENKYKNELFLFHQTKCIKEKENFYRDFLEFKNFPLKMRQIPNSVNFSIEDTIKNAFPLFNDQCSFLEADSIYDRNFKELSRDFDVDKLGDFLDENIELKSLVFFLDAETSALITYKFSKEISKDTTNSENSDSHETKSEDVLLSKSKMKPILKGSKPISSPTINTKTKSAIDKENKTKEKNGKSAEKIVREKLILSIPSLKWTSENSDVPSERNTSNNYDMEYFINGEMHYIEVKASTGTFFMSSAEYDFAKRNLKNYELYLVDLEHNKISGPHGIMEFEPSKRATQFQFFFENE